jgi:hypothetical protein
MFFSFIYYLVARKLYFLIILHMYRLFITLLNILYLSTYFLMSKV